VAPKSGLTIFDCSSKTSMFLQMMLTSLFTSTQYRKMSTKQTHAESQNEWYLTIRRTEHTLTEKKLNSHTIIIKKPTIPNLPFNNIHTVITF
jgi:hypothetical protein